MGVPEGGGNEVKGVERLRRGEREVIKLSAFGFQLAPVKRKSVEA